MKVSKTFHPKSYKFSILQSIQVQKKTAYNSSTRHHLKFTQNLKKTCKISKLQSGWAETKIMAGHGQPIPLQTYSPTKGNQLVSISQIIRPAISVGDYTRPGGVRLTSHKSMLETTLVNLSDTLLAHL